MEERRCVEVLSGVGENERLDFKGQGSLWI